MKVVVTGGTGFVGKYVIEELLHHDIEIVVASRTLNLPVNWLENQKISHCFFDFDELDSKKDYYTYFGKPDKIIHLAWQGLPNYNALFHLEKNVLQHYFFLKNLVLGGLCDVTVTGTCLEYGMQNGCLKEDMPVHPNNPYALAKHTLHEFLNELKKKQFFNLNWIRLFYMHGKGQAPNSLFSQLTSAIERREIQFNMSGGEQERDFLPVETVAKNIVVIALAAKEVGLVNCCSGVPVKVKKLVEDFIASHKADINMNLGFYPYPDYEPMSFWGDNTKLKSII